MENEFYNFRSELHTFLSQKPLNISDILPISDKIVDINVEEPVVKLVNALIKDSISNRASDVHIEPFIDGYRIRYRIDGLLHSISNIAPVLASRVCSRVKILANLNIVEHRLPQDGRFTFLSEPQHSIDCRVSICPTVDGEKIVIRLLNKANVESLTIDALQMETRDKAVFLEALECAQGLILVTGPTGSGKSTTLYTALTYLNNAAVNIISVEDPVEMNISGVNQIQVNSKAGLSFATTLRSILRQDPDIIMIGEIRDLETAKIAIQAAETGHLVLASLHTNSAAQTISRLINIGIPIYNLLNSLRLIIAQRLVRKLCKYCFSLDVDKQNLGCKQCISGYHGRVGLFETMTISSKLTKNIALHYFNVNTFEELACQEGMQLIKNTGLNLVRAGITSIEELRRVVEI